MSYFFLYLYYNIRPICVRPLWNSEMELQKAMLLQKCVRNIIDYQIDHPQMWKIAPRSYFRLDFDLRQSKLVGKN